MQEGEEFKDAEVQRYVSSHQIQADKNTSTSEANQSEYHFRPKTFNEYPGQKFAKENLRVYVKASLGRERCLDHVLLHGPPGLGKTTLAHIIASELNVPFYCTSGPSIDKPGDLAGLLAGLEEGSLLFIDEIHRLTVQVEEVLYSAMEDFSIDIIIGQGATARSVRMPVLPFTLVGATTRLSNLSRPFLSRFGIQEKLEFYDVESLKEIIINSSNKLKMSITSQGATNLARRSRGTPRIALRLLRRVWDFAEVKGLTVIDESIVGFALTRLDIDNLGLDRTDREILKTIIERYKGGPVGIDALSVSIGEEKSTIEEVYEPFLVFQGLISRGPRGRSITELGRTHLLSQ